MKDFVKKLKMTVGIMLALAILLSCAPQSGLSFTSSVFAEETYNYDASMESKDFPLNTNTVDCSHANTELCYTDCITLSAGGHYVEYDINVEQDLKTNISVFCGTMIEGGCLSVSVNGKEQLKEIALSNSGGYGNRAENKLGYIKLSAGKNTIRLTRPSSSKEALVISKFRLAKYFDFDASMESKDFPLNTNTVDCSHANTELCYADCITLSAGGHYVEYDINVEQDLKTNISVFCGTMIDGGCLSVSVNGKEQLKEIALSNSGGYGNRAENKLGYIKLSAGKNTIRLTRPSSSKEALVISKFRLAKYFDYDLDNVTLSKDFPLNINTVDYSHANTALCYADCITLSSGGQYVEYDVIVKNEGRYAVSVSCGTMIDGGCLNVSANGEVQIADKVLPNAAKGYGSRIKQELGNLNLQAGENKLRIACSNATKDSMVIESFNLTKNDNADVKLSLDSPTRLELEDYTNLNVKDKAEASNRKWVCNTWAATYYPIYMYIEAENDGYYNLDYTMITSIGGGPSVINIYLDGEKIADNSGTNYVSVDEAYGKPFAPYAEFNKYTQNRLYIKKGVHAVKVEVLKAGNDVYKYMMDYLEFVPAGGYDIDYFGIVTKEGVKHPYAVRKGYTGYAKVDVLKTGITQKKITVCFAEYAKNGQLVNVKTYTINAGDMEVFKNKEFMFPLTYTQDGGMVKAFVMEGGTLTPLKEASVYEQSEFFPNAQEVMNENTEYELAVNVKDGNGKYYEDCSTHDDKYDIDAIFYDSVVGDQSKVFAYIGVPKGASEENPVPAVVCVHGGGGMAFDTWVKLWNDRGYAAIAMTMTGDGPVKGVTPGTSYLYCGKNKHPYAGTGGFCWGDSAFDKDLEKTTMYRNVLNVIRAHNVLRNYPGVDETKVGITGISWGGITTTTTIGVDDRFVWAVPVYGAGYLYESETYFSKLFAQANYAKEWDPANFAARTRIPTLYINGDSDVNFSITVTSKTCEVTENGRMSVLHNYGHGYDEGWAPEEIYTFADAMINDKADPFITVSNTAAKNGALTAELSYPDNVTIKSVSTYYITSDTHPYNNGDNNGDNINWKLISDYSLTDKGISVNLPSDATFCYATITDNNGSRISTRYVKVSE